MEYAKENGFNPLDPENWYLQSVRSILNRKVILLSLSSSFLLASFNAFAGSDQSSVLPRFQCFEGSDGSVPYHWSPRITIQTYAFFLLISPPHFIDYLCFLLFLFK